MFTQARIKLTLWYLLIILCISGSLSLLFYLRANFVFQQEFARIERRFVREQNNFNPQVNIPPPPRFLPEDLEAAKEQIIIQIIMINGLIVIFFIPAGYFLSGLTLHPIKKTMDEQKRFVSDAAHELKTPLTALKTSLEVSLMDKKLDHKAKKILQENLTDVNSLEKLTQNLLQLAQANNHNLQFKPVSLEKIINQAIKKINPLASKKQIKIKFKKLTQDYKIPGDETSLINLLVIFLDNSVKYSHSETKIAVTVQGLKNSVQVKISDNGIGIEEKHLPFIFNRFYRIDNSRTGSGYGLGLSVAQKIIKQHHGSVKVESQPGKGTTFTLQFPTSQ